MMLLSALEHVQLSDRKQLDLTSELKSDVKDNVEWERKWLVNLDLTKIKLISLHNSIILIINVKICNSIFEAKSSLNILGL